MRYRRFHRRRKLALLGLLLAAGLCCLIRLRFLPTARALAAMQVDNETSNLINAAIDEQLAAAAGEEFSLIRLEQGADGAVRALTADAQGLNRLRSGLLAAISARIPELSEQELGVPLGSVLLPALFSGRGARLPVRLLSLKSSNAEFREEFTQAGINQTLHRIVLEVTVRVLVLAPGGTMELEVKSCVPVAQTVIVGAVPQGMLWHTNE